MIQNKIKYDSVQYLCFKTKHAKKKMIEQLYNAQGTTKRVACISM